MQNPGNPVLSVCMVGCFDFHSWQGHWKELLGSHPSTYLADIP